MTFLTVGYIEWRKGQDILVEAIEQLPDEVVEDSEFIFIGRKDSLMAKELAGRISVMPNVRMPGTVPRHEIHGLMDNADVLVCPSREDPMPTVCAEAMMHHVPCLVSDAAGTSAYIRDGYNGIIFKSEDVSELKDRLVWCFKHKDGLKEMGNRAYEIYESYFSENAFERNLLRYVEEMIGKAED